MGIKHAFQSAKSDGGDSTLVRPSDWNASHTVTSVDVSFIGAAAYNASNAAISTSGLVARSMDSEAYDSDGFHSTSSNTDRFTIPTGMGGKYLLWIAVNLTGDPTNGYVAFRKNAGETIVLQCAFVRDTNTGGYGATGTTVIDLAAGDYISFQTIGQSGTNISAGSVDKPWCGLARLEGVKLETTGTVLSSAYMRVQPVQEKVSANSSTNSKAVTLDTTPTNGNTLFMILVQSSSSGGASSITQTNVTWTKVIGTTSLNPMTELWKGVVGASASTSVTANLNTTAYNAFYIAEFSGIVSTVDQSSVSGATTTGYQTGSITPSNRSLVIAGMGTSDGSTPFGNGALDMGGGIDIAPIAYKALSGSSTALGTVMVGICSAPSGIPTSTLFNSAGGNHTSIIASFPISTSDVLYTLDRGVAQLFTRPAAVNTEDDHFNGTSLNGKWFAYTGNDAVMSLTTLPGWAYASTGGIKLQAVPGGDWTIEVEIVRPNYLSAGYGGTGLILTNGTTQSSATDARWGLGGDNSLGTLRYNFEKFVNGAWSSNYSQTTGIRDIPQHYFLRINKNGSTYRVDYAFGSRLTWTTYASTGSLGFTPTHFGFNLETGSYINYFLRY